MKTAPCYLVVGGSHSRRKTVRRVTQRLPTLAPGEAVVRIVLDLPDALFNSPIHTIEIPLDDLAVAVETQVPQP